MIRLRMYKFAATAACLLLIFTSPRADADLHSYWPLDEVAGTNASNAGPGVDGTLFNGATWVADGTRGQVLQLDGLDGYVNAGTLPALGPAVDFTWSYWASSDQEANNNVIIGNRFPNAGWIKATTNAFEFRDIGSFNNTIDYVDINAGSGWMHHAAVKNGATLTYYRNGLAMGNRAITGTVPAPPFFLGGDTTNENWGGRLDDVALWNDALPTSSIVALANDAAPVPTVPTSDAPVFNQTLFSDDFSTTVNPAKWTSSDRGLENNGPAGYNPPGVNTSTLHLGGTSTNQFWYGSSLESTTSFPIGTDPIEVKVDRVALSGSGTAYRSSLWVFGDDGHYLHLSQNIGETGWSFNARDDGGIGTRNPTGSGFNLALFDAIDADLGLHEMSIVLLPTGTPGHVNMEMYIDGALAAIHGFSNFPPEFRMILTGQARATNDTVLAVFDNASITTTRIIPEPTSAAALLTILAIAATRRRRCV